MKPKQQRPVCKAKTRNGKPCRYKAMWKGYCIQHYRAKQKLKSLKGKIKHGK